MLSKAEYWILDALATGGVRMDWLVAQPEALQVNYFTEPHPLPQEEIQRVILSLCQQGLIEVVASPDDPRSKSFARLTAAGGVAWELWAEPIWALYCEEVGEEDFTYSSAEPRVLLLRFNAQNEERLQQAVYRSSQLYEHRVIGVSSIEPLQPWELFDWKSLPTGVTQLVLMRFEIDQSPFPFRHEWDRGFHQWRTRGFNSSECLHLEQW